MELLTPIVNHNEPPDVFLSIGSGFTQLIAILENDRPHIDRPHIEEIAPLFVSKKVRVPCSKYATHFTGIIELEKYFTAEE